VPWKPRLTQFTNEIEIIVSYNYNFPGTSVGLQVVFICVLCPAICGKRPLPDCPAWIRQLSLMYFIPAFLSLADMIVIQVAS